jgi:hypothetical protein
VVSNPRLEPTLQSLINRASRLKPQRKRAVFLVMSSNKAMARVISHGAVPMSKSSDTAETSTSMYSEDLISRHIMPVWSVHEEEQESDPSSSDGDSSGKQLHLRSSTSFDLQTQYPRKMQEDEASRDDPFIDNSSEESLETQKHRNKGKDDDLASSLGAFYNPNNILAMKGYDSQWKNDKPFDEESILQSEDGEGVEAIWANQRADVITPIPTDSKVQSTQVVSKGLAPEVDEVARGHNDQRKRRRRSILALLCCLVLIVVIAVIVTVSTLAPSNAPTDNGNDPTRPPTDQATSPPISIPTDSPTPRMTKSPTLRPTKSPSLSSTRKPTPKPTSAPTKAPSTSRPTVSPTQSFAPSSMPTSAFYGSVLNAVGAPLQGSEPDQRFGHSVALSENGKIMAVGAPFATLDGESQAGMVQVYEWSSDDNQWVPRGPALMGRNEEDQFGSALALSEDGSVLVASEPTFRGEAGDRSGNVRAFVYGPTNRYEPLGQEVEGEAATDHFGISIALSGDGRRLAVGAPYHDNGGDTRNVSGQVTVYALVENTWKVLGRPLGGSNHLDRFGWKVDMSLDGSVLAVGAPRNLEYGGYVKFYKFSSDDGWSRLGGLVRNEIEPLRYDDNFGQSLRLTGNRRVAIGSPGKNGEALDAGLVAVYELNSENEWRLLGNAITSSAPGSSHQLGFSVDLRGDVLVVGTPGLRQVDLYHYSNDKNNWERHPRPLRGSSGSNFGFSVRLTTSLAVGSAVTGDSNTGMVNVYSEPP